MLGRALVPVVLHPRQNGGINLEMHLGPSNKDQYSQRFCGSIILVPFIYPMRPRVICKGTSEEHVKLRKLACVSEAQRKICPKVNSTVVFFIHFEWSGL